MHATVLERQATRQRSAIGDLERQYAESAVGRPFPVSKTSLRNCLGSRRRDPSCQAMREFLEKMQPEPRDNEWARDTEERVERFIESIDGGRHTIRSLQCRTKRYALEVVALNDQLVWRGTGDPKLDDEVAVSALMVAQEPTTNGDTLVATMLVIRRLKFFPLHDGKLVDD